MHLLGNRLLIKKVKPKLRTSLDISSDNEVRSDIGEIVCVGADIKEPAFQVGSFIHFASYNVTEIQSKPDMGTVMEDDVIAISDREDLDLA